MAVATTDTVLNYSGILKTKSDNSTRLLDAIYARGRANGEGISSRGTRKVNSIEFALAAGYTNPEASQPEISETASLTATPGENVTRKQEKNNIQIFQEAVTVSYLKQSAIGTMAGINVAGQTSNVTNEMDFQVAQKLLKMKKDLDYTYINGVQQDGSSAATAWKSKGLIAGLTTNVSTYASSGLTEENFEAFIIAAMKNGFQFKDGVTELWCNPADLKTLDKIFQSSKGFALPSTRTDGGIAISNIVTHFGMLNINYDMYIPAKTYLVLNMDELAVAEMDFVDKDGVNKGCWFYEALGKDGAGEKGQLYGQAGIDFGAEWNHIKITQGA